MSQTLSLSSSPSSESLSDFLDYVKTPLNPCSLESLPYPIRLPNGSLSWPLMLGSYELDEQLGQRRGRLDLFSVCVPARSENDGTEKNDDKHHQHHEACSLVGLGKPVTVLGGDSNISTASTISSGILDGKWYHQGQNDNKASFNKDFFFYASAHASGDIVVHNLQVNTMYDDDDDEHVLQAEPFQVVFAGKSEPVDQHDDRDDDILSLCLALSWDMQENNKNQPSDQGNTSSRIISSYSNGRVVIHQVALCCSTGKARFTEQHSWKAHTMFQSHPAEVWSASFSNFDKNVVLTGGDEGNLKIWDLRNSGTPGNNMPIHTLKHFEAGVTALSPHPQNDYLIACGCYDETIMFLDLRQASQSKPRPLYHSEPLGGGIWRIKWHPYDREKLLLGAMHGGCLSAKLNGVNLVLGEEHQSMSFEVKQKFTNHNSMVYGADWLVYQTPDNRQSMQAAVSCSFYDRALYLWNVK